VRCADGRARLERHGLDGSASAQGPTARSQTRVEHVAWLIIRPEWLPRRRIARPIPADPEQRQHMTRMAGQVTVRLADWRDPCSSPGRRADAHQVTAASAGCPLGAGELLSGRRARAAALPGEPFYFHQTPKVVYMIWQRDHMVRRIYMTDKHSDHVKPSWFGSRSATTKPATLVVDTIGLAAEKS